MKGFKSADIYVEGKGIVRTDLCFDEKIVAIGSCTVDEPLTIPSDATVFPGFIDEHIHGAMGQDTMDGTIKSLSLMAEALLKEGTTGFLATTMTQSKQNITRALENVRNYMATDNKNGAEVLGVHLEGPYISEKYIGAQPLCYVKKPDCKEFDDYFKASGEHIKIVTVAPEQAGAPEFIRHLRSLGVVASIGHTAAKYSDIQTAVEAGATNVTHTYNAQSPLHHRDIGTVGAALLCDELNCELICDTIHVSKPAIKLLVKNKPHDKLTLITDAMRAKQMPDGISELGGQTVIVKNGEARLENGALAGSVLKMNDAIKNLVGNGVPVCDAVDFATINPARTLKIDDIYGSVKVGKAANFTVLDSNFEVLMTIRGGKVLYRR